VSEPVIIGRATLFNADCRDVLPTLDRGNAIVSDPPYGVPILTNTAIGKRGGALKKNGRAWKPVIGNEAPFDPDSLLDFSEVLLWGANHFAHRLPHNGRWLIWDKRCGVIPQRTQADCELAWVKDYGAARMIRFLWDGICQDEKKGERFHPTEKPEGVMKWCLGFVKARMIVDPFMGSGSTGVAAVQQGRDFIGIELDPDYFATACRRLEQAQRQGDFFVEAA
jgi:site-specific DNA-methyltransferase (adenine-specific)